MNDTEILPFVLETNFSPNDSSIFIQTGSTSLVISIFGPHADTKLSTSSASGSLVVSFEIEDGNLEDNNAKSELDILYLQSLVTSIFSQTICFETFPKSIININILLLEIGPSLKSTIINGVTFALLASNIPIDDHIIAFDLMRNEKNQIKFFPGNDANKSSNCGALTVAFKLKDKNIIYIDSSITDNSNNNSNKNSDLELFDENCIEFCKTQSDKIYDLMIESNSSNK